MIEVSTGTVACERAADERRSIASTTKLMTALLTLERAKLSDTFTAARYFPAGAESKIGLEPGERMSVRDLMRGLLIESGNDAAVTLAEGVSGSRRAFVRAMNRRALQLELKQHPLRQPDRARRGRQLLLGARPRAAGDRAARPTASSARRSTGRASRSTSGNRTRRFNNRNDLVARFRWINGVKSGHTRQAGYVLVGSGRDSRGVQLVSAVLGTPSLGARDDGHARRCCRSSFKRFQRITAVKRDEFMTRVPIRYRRGAELSLVAGRSLKRIVPRGHRDDVTRA